MPVVVAHGEGRVQHENIEPLQTSNLVCLRYVNSQREVVETYPQNPNGSPFGITAVTNEDGRFTIMMPHPERLFRSVQFSWHPDDWGEESPWMRMFHNARLALN